MHVKGQVSRKNIGKRCGCLLKLTNFFEQVLSYLGTTMYNRKLSCFEHLIFKNDTRSLNLLNRTRNYQQKNRNKMQCHLETANSRTQNQWQYWTSIEQWLLYYVAAALIRHFPALKHVCKIKQQKLF